MSATAAPSLALVAFLLDGRRYAVELARIDRAVPMVAVTPLPGAPAVVAGVFTYHGQLVPVMNVRRRFGLPERAAAPSDRLLLVHTPRRVVAFAVDAVEPAFVVPADEVAPSSTVVSGLEHVRGIVQLLGAGLILVQDVDAFLALDEVRQLETALKEARG